MISIYLLKNPISGEVFYIGQTSQKYPKTRLNQHCNHALRGYGNNHKKSAYIKRILAKGSKPILQVIDTCSNNDRIYPHVERYWINCYKCLGCKLLNLTAGGEKVDREVNRLGGIAARGIKLSTRECTSRYVGVRWHNKRKKWQAYIHIGKKQHHLGVYSTEEEAARAYDRASLLLINCEEIKLNFDKGNYLSEDLQKWYTSLRRKKSSKQKYVHFCKTHKKWLVTRLVKKAKRFDTEEQAIAYIESILALPDP